MGLGTRTLGISDLQFPGCYLFCPSMQRADENSEPEVTPSSPPLHAQLPFGSHPHADHLPFRLDVSPTGTALKNEATLL